MATPLKIKDGSGNIQEMTTSDENYLAYHIGLHLAASDSAGDYGSINTDSSFTSVGTFTNTFFNEPVGTAPSTSITSGSTTSTIYQNQLQNALETDSDTLSPLMWVDSSGQTGFKEMPDLDLNDAVDRYLSTIFTNDYPGSYRLASTAPSGDYSVHLSNVFTDTRTDGTSVTYNIYQRDTMTAPAAVSPIYVEDSAGGTGLKLKPMTDRQIKYSFGQRAKNRVGGSKIGSYQLRSSAQGAPTDPGTWVARGTADDTKQTTADVSYSRSFEANYEANYVKGYTTDYSGSYSRLYTGGTEVDYLRRFEGVYSRLAAVGQGYVNYAEYSRSFIANYQDPGSYFSPSSLVGYEGVGVNYLRENIYFDEINLFKFYTGTGVYARWIYPYEPDFASYGNVYAGEYATFDALYDGLRAQYTRQLNLYDSGAQYTGAAGTKAYQSAFFVLNYTAPYTSPKDYTAVFANNRYSDSVSYTSGEIYAQYYVNNPFKYGAAVYDGSDTNLGYESGGYTGAYNNVFYVGLGDISFGGVFYTGPGPDTGYAGAVSPSGFAPYYTGPGGSSYMTHYTGTVLVNYLAAYGVASVYVRWYSTGDDGGAQIYQRDGAGATYNQGTGVLYQRVDYDGIGFNWFIGTYAASYDAYQSDGLVSYSRSYDTYIGPYYVRGDYEGALNYYTGPAPLYTTVYAGVKQYLKQYINAYQGTYTGPNLVQYSIAGTIYDGGGAQYAGYTSVSGTQFLSARQYTSGDLYLPGGQQVVAPNVAMPPEGYIGGIDQFTVVQNDYNIFDGTIYASIPSYNLSYTSVLNFARGFSSAYAAYTGSTGGGGGASWQYAGYTRTYSRDYSRFIQYNKEYVPTGFNGGYVGLGGTYEITSFYESDTGQPQVYQSGPDIGIFYQGPGSYLSPVGNYLLTAETVYSRGYSGDIYAGYDAQKLAYTAETAYSHFASYGVIGGYNAVDLFYSGVYINELTNDSYTGPRYTNLFDNVYIGPGGYETSIEYVRTREEPYGLTNYVGGTEIPTYTRTLGYTRRYITNANYTNAYDPTYIFPLQFYAAYTKVDGPFYDTPDTFVIGAIYAGPSYLLSYDVNAPYTRIYDRDTYTGSVYADAFGGLGYLQDFSSPPYTGAPIGYGVNYLSGPPYYLVNYTGPGTQYYAGPGTTPATYLGAANYTGVVITNYVLTGDVQSYLGNPSFIGYYTGFGAYLGTYAGAYVKDILYSRAPPTYTKNYTLTIPDAATYVDTVNYTAGPYTGTTNLFYISAGYANNYTGGNIGYYTLASYLRHYLGPAPVTYVRNYSRAGGSAYYTRSYARATAFYAGSGRNSFYLRSYLNTGATLYYAGGNYARDNVANTTNYGRNYILNYTGDLSYYLVQYTGNYTRAVNLYYIKAAYQTNLYYTGPDDVPYARNYAEGPYVGPPTNFTVVYLPPTANYGTAGFYLARTYTGGGYDRVGAIYEGSLGTPYGEGTQYTGFRFYQGDYNLTYSGPVSPTYTGGATYAGVQYLGAIETAPVFYLGPIQSYIPGATPYYIPDYEGSLYGEVYYDQGSYIQYAGPQADAPVAYGSITQYDRLVSFYTSDLYTGYLPAGQYLLSYTGPTYTGVYIDQTPAQNYTSAAFTTQYVRGDIGAQPYVGSYAGASLFLDDGHGAFEPNVDYAGYSGKTVYAGPEAVFTSVYQPGVVYSRRFSREDYTGSFGSIEDTFIGGFSDQYATLYSRIYSVQFLESYQSNYTTIYTTTYESTYLTDYLNEYTGSFEGETIEATDEIIETYTLYVRIA